MIITGPVGKGKSTYLIRYLIDKEIYPCFYEKINYASNMGTDRNSDSLFSCHEREHNSFDELLQNREKPDSAVEYAPCIDDSTDRTVSVSSATKKLSESDLDLIDSIIDKKFFGYITLSRLTDTGTYTGAKRLFYFADIKKYLKLFFRKNRDIRCISENELTERIGRDLKNVSVDIIENLGSAELFPPKNEHDRLRFIEAVRCELRKINEEIRAHIMNGEKDDVKILIIDETMGIELAEPKVVKELLEIFTAHKGKRVLVCKSSEHRRHLQSYFSADEEKIRDNLKDLLHLLQDEEIIL